MKLCFPVSLEKACMLCYAFSERFKFEVVKIDETASKNVIEEEHGQFGNEGF